MRPSCANSACTSTKPLDPNCCPGALTPSSSPVRTPPSFDPPSAAAGTTPIPASVRRSPTSTSPPTCRSSPRAASTSRPAGRRPAWDRWALCPGSATSIPATTPGTTWKKAATPACPPSGTSASGWTGTTASSSAGARSSTTISPAPQYLTQISYWLDEEAKNTKVWTTVLTGPTGRESTGNTTVLELGIQHNWNKCVYQIIDSQMV